jgi:hypothetical protein
MKMDLQNVMKCIRSKVQTRMSGMVYELLASPTVTGSIVKAIETSFSFKTAVDKNLQFAYKSMNLPSRADFDNLAAKVNKLTRKQEVLDSKIEMLSKKIDRISQNKGEDKT